jgi:hypothetical protein
MVPLMRKVVPPIFAVCVPPEIRSADPPTVMVPLMRKVASPKGAGREWTLTCSSGLRAAAGAAQGRTVRGREETEQFLADDDVVRAFGDGGAPRGGRPLGA